MWGEWTHLLQKVCAMLRASHFEKFPIELRFHELRYDCIFCWSNIKHIWVRLDSILVYFLRSKSTRNLGWMCWLLLNIICQWFVYSSYCSHLNVIRQSNRRCLFSPASKSMYCLILSSTLRCVNKWLLRFYRNRKLKRERVVQKNGLLQQWIFIYWPSSCCLKHEICLGIHKNK